MTREEFLDQQFSLSVTAGMNQRYHQLLMTRWAHRDLYVKAFTAVVAVAGTAFALAGLNERVSQLIVVVGTAFSVVTSIAAVVLNVVPFGSWEQSHRDLFRQWTDLREDVDSLLFRAGSGPESAMVDEAVIRELERLTAKSHRICGQEPAPDEKILQKCHEAEGRSRTIAA